MPKKSRRRNKRKKSRTRKKRGAVKFGKNKTTADIVKEGRKILKTTPQRKKRQDREKQIKLTGEKEFALFKQQALNEMRITFEQTFRQAPSDNDRKILSLVYKSLKDPLSKAEEDYIKKYRADESENKIKYVWMNNYLRQLKEKSQLKQFDIYKHGDNPKALLKYKTRKKRLKRGPASGLVINITDMSPIKGPDTRYPELSKEIGNRGKNLFNNKRQEDPKEIGEKGKNLFQKSQQGGRKKKGGRRTRRKRGSNGKKTKKGITKHDGKGLPPPNELVQVDKPDDRFIMGGKRRTKKKAKKKTHKKKNRR
mgnify:CR=1 FL=1|tara:strand:+ start:75 stop:1001 length:927 start_codon:yes stop_codon:yes gene_type:complete